MQQSSHPMQLPHDHAGRDWQGSAMVAQRTLLPLQHHQHEQQHVLPLAALLQAQAQARPAPGLAMQDLLRLAMANATDPVAGPPRMHGPAMPQLPAVQQLGSDVPFSLGPLDPFAGARHHTPMGISPMVGAAVAPAAHRAPDAASYLTAHLAASGPSRPAGAPAPAKRESDSDAEESENDRESRGSVNTIFPRRKQGQHARTNSQPVVLNEATLSQLFTLPLHKAAVKLGISATAMKSACRKLGIKKWPYRALSVTTTKAQRSQRTRSPPATPPRRSSGLSSLASCASDASSAETASGRTAYPSSDLSQDAMLLAETMRLLQQGVNRVPQEHDDERKRPSISASSSACGSELSGASTREDYGVTDGCQELPAAASASAPNSVASLLN
eukprot:Tamp_14750.p1 GENE.Tamp_14750~~Tamp_14750.p1  ORF type:complete len:443 (+),score=85.01 Tamp_14750:169-1329(+)